MNPRTSAAVALLAVVTIITPCRAACRCGYLITNSTTSTPNAALAHPFTDVLETNFLVQPSVDAWNSSWIVQYYRDAYNASANSSDWRYGKSAQRDTIVNNPLVDRGDYDKGGVLAGVDPGLQLWVRGGLPGDKVIPVSEISTKRTDLRYGSFRAGIKATRVNGTCAAFFWYISDTDEMDMELLSREYNSTSSAPINLSLHSLVFPATGYYADDTTPYTHQEVSSLPFVPYEGFHEYRFDWTPELVSFYVDGVWLREMDTGVPSIGGPVLLNHWSDGREDWSGGPPTTDAVITVAYVKAYFNSSAERRTREFENTCAGAARGDVCRIPDQVGELEDAGMQSYYVIPNQRTAGGKRAQAEVWILLAAAAIGTAAMVV